jgi:hypothetical protein
VPERPWDRATWHPYDAYFGRQLRISVAAGSGFAYLPGRSAPKPASMIVAANNQVSPM